MSLSIRTKLFLTLLAAGSLAVVGMHAFMRWSFHNGLVQLAQGREQERLEWISERLVERYREDAGWGRLASDKGLWIATLTGFGERLPLRHSGAAPGHIPELGRHMGRMMRHRLDEPGVWPPTRAVDRARRPDGPPLRLELRLMLLNMDGTPIYARPELIPGTARFPLRMDGARIGELALIPGPFLPESGELRFKERQGEALALIALAMTLLSAAFAFPLAKRLSKPVQGFQETARRLATGDFGARVATLGNDELGRLGRDINALAEALERNEQARRRWVADISHELRTPIAVLRAEIEALEDGVRPLDAHAVESLHGDVLRLGRLVDDLYELSMTDLGALSYRKAETNPVEVLEEDLRAFRHELSGAGLKLSFDNRLERQITLHADAHRLSQLFRNLLRNSIQYTDPNGELRVEVTRQEDSLEIGFQDSLPGVSRDSSEHLFERLYRVDASRSRNTGGAGLGLAICRNIVEAHGGSIEARPSPLGGLHIRILLPLTDSFT